MLYLLPFPLLIKMPNYKHYKSYYLPVGEAKDTEVDIELERRNKYALLREAGLNVPTSRRARDWHWRDVLGVLDIANDIKAELH